MHLPRFLHRKPSVLEAFSLFWLICFVQVRSLLILNPRYFPLSTTCTCVFIKGVGRLVVLTSSWDAIGWPHFSGWKHISHFLSYSSNEVRSFCNKPPSFWCDGKGDSYWENVGRFNVDASGRSMEKAKRSNGFITVPWGYSRYHVKRIRLVVFQYHRLFC